MSLWLLDLVQTIDVVSARIKFTFFLSGKIGMLQGEKVKTNTSCAKESIRGSIPHSASLESQYWATDGNGLFFLQVRYTGFALSNSPTFGK